MFKTWINAFSFILLMFTAVSWATPVPDTGQTKCYNNTVEIPCPSPGQPFYGQDANTTINPMFYTKLDAIGNDLPYDADSWVMVRDNVTGLIWEVKNRKDGKKDYANPNDADNTYTWDDSNTDIKGFIKALNDANYGGYSDWSLPTMKELASIVNFSVGPTIDSRYFPNTVPSLYWSSYSSVSTYPRYGTSLYRWGVNFLYGGDNYYLNWSGYVRAVRGGQSELLDHSVIGSFDSEDSISMDGVATAAGSYTDNGDGTVTDNSSGLMWEQADSSKKTWEQALSYCEGLKLGDYTDWRLPTIKELRSLVDYNRLNLLINTTYFPAAVLSFYWASTTNVNNTSSAWGMNFYYRGSGSYSTSKNTSVPVRAVRGGQSVPFAHLVISPSIRNVAKDKGTTTFSVANTGTATMPWTAAVTSVSSWLTIKSGGSGSNSGTITCEFSANTSTSARTGTIRVTATGGATDSPVDVTVTQAGIPEKFFGAWSDGVWIWHQPTKQWSKIPSTANALMIAAGKVDSDAVEDLIGVWSSGLWVLNSSNGQWLQLSQSLPTWITAGDLNNDGRDDVIGSWANDGVYYRDSATEKWVKITSPAKQLATGNVGGDGRDDLVGVWDSGLWLRYSKTNDWQKIDPSIPVWTTAGDMTGDKRADIIGSYTSGTWYRNSATGAWTNLTTPAEQLASGDIDGDGRDDLIGVWSNGVWVRYGATGKWEQITASKPKWITTSRIADAVQTAGALEDPLKSIVDIVDLSQEGPDGVATNILILEEEGPAPQK